VTVLVDNDVLVKGSCYDLLPALFGISTEDHEAAILGATRFVVPKLLRRVAGIIHRERAEETFRRFAERVESVEPTPEEQALAAELETVAQKLAVNLDTGESQLSAILVSRAIPYLVTGDKRAIRALERLIEIVPALGEMTARVRCLEQCVRHLVTQGDLSAVRDAICAEPAVDKTLSICCSCTGSATSPDVLLACLDAYINELRSEATRVLATE
jgi:hypothetical protein